MNLRAYHALIRLLPVVQMSPLHLIDTVLLMPPSNESWNRVTVFIEVSSVVPLSVVYNLTQNVLTISRKAYLISLSKNKTREHPYI
jgi:hypothetical protein